MSSTPVGLLLLIQVILIAINSFFAAAEIAIVSLSEGKLRHQVEEGDKKAKKLLKLVTEPSGFLSTIQIAITLAGFLGSAFASDNFSDMLVDWIVNDLQFTAMSPAALNTVCVIVITLILSYFTLVLGELVPKRIAMKKGESVARFVCGPVYGMSRIFKPIVALLTFSVNVVLRCFGIDPKADDEEVTEDEIRVRCSAVKYIIFHSNLPWVGGRTVEGEGLTETSYQINRERGERFVRIILIDEAGRRAWANPIEIR